MFKRTERKFIKCWNCGKDTKYAVGAYASIRQFCPLCWEKYKDNKLENTKKHAYYSNFLMHERALRILEKQEVDMYEYQEASEAVLDLALRSEISKFRSADEMVAAMELLRNYVQIKMQRSVGAYKIDIYIEPFKVALEVDGHYHENKKVKDNKRDIEIRQMLGKDWEIIRIPTKYVEGNIQQLIPAIEKIKEYKQSLRKVNNGIIPESYSDREKQHYELLLKGMKKTIREPKI
jgi:very-short-patch-repair endonuclease